MTAAPRPVAAAIDASLAQYLDSTTWGGAGGGTGGAGGGVGGVGGVYGGYGGQPYSCWGGVPGGGWGGSGLYRDTSSSSQTCAAVVSFISTASVAFTSTRHVERSSPPM